MVDRVKGFDSVTVGSVNFNILLYADDIVLVCENAEGLQRLLDRCQEYADEFSFEFSMKKSYVVVFGEDID